jgi:hypothetical protein
MMYCDCDCIYLVLRAAPGSPQRLQEPIISWPWGIRGQSYHLHIQLNTKASPQSTRACSPELNLRICYVLPQVQSGADSIRRLLALSLRHQQQLHHTAAGKPARLQQLQSHWR